VAIGTYSELKDAVANWLDRGDLTDRIPEFIQLAETDINSQFNHRDIESTSTLTPVVGSHTIALPTGYREPLNLWGLWSGSAGTFEVRASIREAMAITTVNSIPQAWCVDGDTIYFDCPNISASDYSFLFRWVGGVALSDSTTTNLVLTNYPNVYLFGALKEAAPYLRDPDAMVMWEGKYRDAVAAARAKEAREKALTTLSTEPGMLTHRRHSFNINRGS
jgi:hypothetical protein